MPFMLISTAEFSQAEAREYTDNPEARAGWYSRLSAPGYMDCTDWDGPYPTESEAAQACADTFDICVECSGDDWDDNGNCRDCEESCQ